MADNSPSEKNKEKYFKNEERKECSRDEKEFIDDTFVSSPMKRKSEQIVLDVKRKRSTDRTQKESDEENSADSSNGEDIGLSESLLVECKKRMTTTVECPMLLLPNNKKEPIDEQNLLQIDQSTIKHSEKYTKITFTETALNKNFSFLGAPDQSNTDPNFKPLLQNPSIKHTDISHSVKKEMTVNRKNAMKDTIIDSKYIEIGRSNEKEVKLLNENLPTKKRIMNDEKSSKYDETGNISPKNKQSYEIPVNSPVKRKDILTIDDDIKLKRSIDSVRKDQNDENLNDSLNIQDTTLTACQEKFEKDQSSVVNYDNTKEATKEQSTVLKKVDEFSEGKNSGTIKSNSRTQTTETLGEKTDKTLDKTILFKFSEGRQILENSSINSISDNTDILDARTGAITDRQNVCCRGSIFESRMDSGRRDAVIKCTSKLKYLPKIPKFSFPEKNEEKLDKLPSQVVGTERQIAYDTSLQTDKQSSDMVESNISSTKTSIGGSPNETLSHRGRKSNPEHLTDSRPSPEKQSSSPEYKLHPIYTEPEPEFVSIESYENDEEFIESQKQILAKIQFHEQHSKHANIRDRWVIPNSFKNMDPEVVNRILSAAHELVLEKEKFDSYNQYVPYHPISHPEYQKKFAEDLNTLEGSGQDYEKSMYAPKDEVHGKQLQQITQATDRAWESGEFTRSPDLSPRIKTPSPPDLSPRIKNPSPPDLSPHIENESPPELLSPIENETDEISETEYPKFREYPGLAEEPSKVKKDARYQKRFYKMKPVKLPVNWKVDRSSSPETESDTEPEENKMHKTRDIPGIISRDKDSAEEEKESNEHDSQILLKDKQKGTSPEEGLPKTPTKSVEDKINSPSAWKLQPLSLPASPNSPTKNSKSDSPKTSNEKKSPCMSEKVLLLEGLAARILSSPVRKSQPSSSPVRMLQPPSSPASPISPTENSKYHSPKTNIEQFPRTSENPSQYEGLAARMLFSPARSSHTPKSPARM